MNIEKKSCTRREFVKTTGGLSLASLFAGIGTLVHAYGKTTGDDPKKRGIPMRVFGKTGVEVPILALGGSLDLVSRQSLLKRAFEAGVTYWDTAESYAGGKSEEGIGNYFARHPSDRERVFLVTKCDSNRPSTMTHALEQSLKRMKTSYVDLYFLHSVSDVSELDPGVRHWAERAKKTGRIRFFGFSTHSNMEECMFGAAKLGWIDGIMMSYNYRAMEADRMKAAVEACAKAGIGMTAMKTQGRWSWISRLKRGGKTSDLAERFQKKGFTKEQAKLKAVWTNTHIASICSHMPNLKTLVSNVSAARNPEELSRHDLRRLSHSAAASACEYCTGCARICESAVGEDVPIRDIMRYLMYSRSYEEHARARVLFGRIPPDTRHLLVRANYREAERRCPQGMPIGRLVKEALKELA